MMEMKWEDPKPVRKAGSYEVIVVGGGIAGISAAVASAREGASTLLLEKGIVLGGLATAGLINWYEPLCDGEGTQMIAGIAQELLLLAAHFGPDDLPKVWRDKSRTGRVVHPSRRYASHFSPTIFALAFNSYIEENHVHLLLDAHAAYPVMERNNCTGVVVLAKEGRLFFEAGMVIDATGDASILHAGGCPTADGKNYLSYIAHFVDKTGVENLMEKNDFCYLRKWKIAGASMTGIGHPENTPFYAGVTSEEITNYVRIGQKMMLEQIESLPAGSFDLTGIPSMPQLRTCRRLEGAYTFTGTDEDRFADVIGACGDFRTAGKRWQLPYRILYHPAFPNLLAAGRIVSADGEGWEITRVIPVCALTGQAAGIAAALSIKEDCGVQELDIDRLQESLRRQGVILDWIPGGRPEHRK